MSDSMDQADWSVKSTSSLLLKKRIGFVDISFILGKFPFNWNCNTDIDKSFPRIQQATKIEKEYKGLKMVEGHSLDVLITRRSCSNVYWWTGMVLMTFLEFLFQGYVYQPQFKNEQEFF